MKATHICLQVKMRIESVSSSNEGQYRLVNDQGSSDEASLVMVVDGVMGPWAEYGPCSKTCTQANNVSGEAKGGCDIIDDHVFIGTQERKRQCIPPKNGGLPCTAALMESRPCGTQACPGSLLFLTPKSFVAVNIFWNRQSGS